MVKLITQAAYARHRKVTRQTIFTWKKQGRIIMRGNKVDVVASDARLKETECPGRKAGADERAGKRSADNAEFYESRAALLAIHVQQAQIELDQTIDAVILREDAERQALEDEQRFKACMMGLPDKYADRLATITNVRETREALRLMLRDAICEVANG